MLLGKLNPNYTFNINLHKALQNRCVSAEGKLWLIIFASLRIKLVSCASSTSKALGVMYLDVTFWVYHSFGATKVNSNADLCTFSLTCIPTGFCWAHIFRETWCFVLVLFSLVSFPVVLSFVCFVQLVDLLSCCVSEMGCFLLVLQGFRMSVSARLNFTLKKEAFHLMRLKWVPFGHLIGCARVLRLSSVQIGRTGALLLQRQKAFYVLVFL